MTKKIELSIIIVNYNTYRFADKCLKSIYKSIFPHNQFEIIVVDNASEDRSVPLLKKKFPQIKLISNRENVGFARANNQAIKETKGRYVLLLNPDTLISKNTLFAMIKFMDKNKSAGIATCRIELPRGELDDACHRGFPTPWNALCQFSGIASIFPSSPLFNGYHLGFKKLDSVHGIDSCAGAFMLIRKSTGEKLNWLDEDYFWYGEDIDFCYRAKKAGWQVMFVPGVKILHYKGISGGIKKHSLAYSTANRSTQILAMKARFAVMRIFYNKHYKYKYPRWLTWLVMKAIKVKEYINLQKY